MTMQRNKTPLKGQNKKKYLRYKGLKAPFADETHPRAVWSVGDVIKTGITSNLPNLALEQVTDGEKSFLE